jgi:hypothetical protein
VNADNGLAGKVAGVSCQQHIVAPKHEGPYGRDNELE